MNEYVYYGLKLPAVLYHRFSAEEVFASEACGWGGNIQLEQMFLEYVLRCNRVCHMELPCLF